MENPTNLSTQPEIKNNGDGSLDKDQEAEQLQFEELYLPEPIRDKTPTEPGSGLEAKVVTYSRNGKQIEQQRFYSVDENGKKHQLKNDDTRAELAPHMEKLFQVMAGGANDKETPQDVESLGPIWFNGYEPGQIEKVPTDKLNRLLDAAISRAAQSELSNYEPGYKFAIKHAELFFDELAKRENISDEQRDLYIDALNQKLNDLTSRGKLPGAEITEPEQVATETKQNIPRPATDSKLDTAKQIEQIDQKMDDLIAGFRKARKEGRDADANQIQKAIYSNFNAYCKLNKLNSDQRGDLEKVLVKNMLTRAEYKAVLAAEAKPSDKIKVLDDEPADSDKIKVLPDEAEAPSKIKILDDEPRKKGLKRLAHRLSNLRKSAYAGAGLRIAGVKNTEVMDDNDRSNNKRRKIIGAVAVLGAGAAAFYIGKKAGFDLAPSFIDGDSLDLNGAKGFNGVDLIPWVDGDGFDLNGSDAGPRVAVPLQEASLPDELNVTDGQLPWNHVSDQLGGGNSTPRILELVNKGASHGWEFAGNGLDGGNGAITSVTTPDGITYTDNGHINAALDFVSNL